MTKTIRYDRCIGPTVGTRYLFPQTLALCTLTGLLGQHRKMFIKSSPKWGGTIENQHLDSRYSIFHPTLIYESAISSLRSYINCNKIQQFSELITLKDLSIVACLALVLPKIGPFLGTRTASSWALVSDRLRFAWKSANNWFVGILQFIRFP